jgi:hypothetical protein
LKRKNWAGCLKIDFPQNSKMKATTRYAPATQEQYSAIIDPLRTSKAHSSSMQFVRMLEDSCPPEIRRALLPLLHKNDLLSTTSLSNLSEADIALLTANLSIGVKSSFLRLQEKIKNSVSRGGAKALTTPALQKKLDKTKIKGKYTSVRAITPTSCHCDACDMDVAATNGDPGNVAKHCKGVAHKKLHCALMERQGREKFERSRHDSRRYKTIES